MKAIAVAAALLGLLGSTPASAAAGVGTIELSDDGITFADSYPGSLFDSIALLVPGDSQSETIYVHNGGTAAGYLRITLADVTYSDRAYADALRVTTSTPDNTGTAHAISSANPCQVTSEGILVQPGAIVPVNTQLTLGNLNGSDGQSATASLTLRLTLTDTALGSLPPTSCGSIADSGTVIPVVPATPSTPAGDGTGGATSPDNSGAVIQPGSGIPVPTPSPSPAITEAAPNAGLVPSFSAGFSLDPNTWRLYQEYLVLILVLAAMIGAFLSWLVGRRRTRKDAESA